MPSRTALLANSSAELATTILHNIPLCNHYLTKLSEFLARNSCFSASCSSGCFYVWQNGPFTLGNQLNRSRRAYEQVEGGVSEFVDVRVLNAFFGHQLLDPRTVFVSEAQGYSAISRDMTGDRNDDRRDTVLVKRLLGFDSPMG